MTDRNRILTPEERRQRNRDEMTDAILQVAREIMREQGVGALNLQELARRVGMRAPSLYNYFASKHAIYEALFVMGMRMYRESFERIMYEYGATWEGLEKSLEGYFTFALENPELYQLLFERPVPGFVPSPEGLEEGRKLIAVGNQMSERAIAAGMFPPSMPPDVLTNLIVSLMHGFTAMHLANEPHLPMGEGRFGSLIPVIVTLLKQAQSGK